MSYKLRRDENIIYLPDGAVFPPDPLNRYYQDYLAWLAAGNTPEPADELTPEQLAREAEVLQAIPTARAYFLSHPAAVSFIRLTPAEQETWIDNATTAQLKALIVYLTVAVSAAIKREYL